MGVGSSSSGASNFFGAIQSDFNIIGDAKDALFDHKGWDQVQADVQNTRIGFQNAIMGTHQAKYETAAQKEQDQIKAQRDNLMRATNTNSTWNASNWQSISSKAANSAYSKQSPINGVAKPSDLMSISDPSTKVMNSKYRGTNKTLWGVAKNGIDNAAADHISSATTGNPMPSDTINSAGGSGLTVSQDQQGASQSVSSGGSAASQSMSSGGSLNTGST